MMYSVGYSTTFQPGGPCSILVLNHVDFLLNRLVLGRFLLVFLLPPVIFFPAMLHTY